MKIGGLRLKTAQKHAVFSTLHRLGGMQLTFWKEYYYSRNHVIIYFPINLI